MAYRIEEGVTPDFAVTGQRFCQDTWLLVSRWSASFAAGY